EKPAGTKAAKANGPVFKVQILTSPTQLKTTDRQFKGLKGVEFYRESNKYKYTYGASTDYNEILKLKKEITSKFADCFIIAFQNGEKMNVNEAIALFKKQHNKR
ncbi:MAG: N-acetylmuramoyl-L-alanine amidase, partial [Bacteroidaceae bacterium]|nr:N-acetylmuramoyl-L-alanine amidase [Bacteroidaceae bacterium]